MEAEHMSGLGSVWATLPAGLRGLSERSELMHPGQPGHDPRRGNDMPSKRRRSRSRAVTLAFVVLCLADGSRASDVASGVAAEQRETLASASAPGSETRP